MKPKYKSKMRQKQRERARENRAESKESNKPKTTSAERMRKLKKPQGCETGYSPRSFAKIRNNGAKPHLLNMPVWRGA
jgi:hypothetical protein